MNEWEPTVYVQIEEKKKMRMLQSHTPESCVYYVEVEMGFKGPNVMWSKQYLIGAQRFGVRQIQRKWQKKKIKGGGS